MKQKLLLLPFITLCFFLMSTNVMAYPTIQTETIMLGQFFNYENIIKTNAAGDSEVMLPGETFDLTSYDYDFIGVYTLSGLKTSSGSPTWGADQNSELTGAFKYSLGSTETTQYEVFAGVYVPAIKLNFFIDEADNDFIELYYDDTPDFNIGTTGTAFNPIDAGQMATNTGASNDGDLWLGLYSNTNLLSSYSYLLPATNPADSKIFNYAWFNPDVFNQPGVELVPQLWPNLYLDNPNNDPIESEIYMESEINLANNAEIPLFTYHSDDPMMFYATPEPSTILIFGFGLIGFAGLVRRRQNN